MLLAEMPADGGDGRSDFLDRGGEIVRRDVKAGGPVIRGGVIGRVDDRCGSRTGIRRQHGRDCHKAEHPLNYHERARPACGGVIQR